MWRKLHVMVRRLSRVPLTLSVGLIGVAACCALAMSGVKGVRPPARFTHVNYSDYGGMVHKQLRAAFRAANTALQGSENGSPLVAQRLKDAERSLETTLCDLAGNDGQLASLVGVTLAYDLLATIVYQEGDARHAEAVLSGGVGDLLGSGVSPSDPRIGRLQLRLARLLAAEGRTREAQDTFVALRRTQDGSDNTQGEDPSVWLHMPDTSLNSLRLDTLYWHSRLLSACGRHTEAADALERALGITALGARGALAAPLGATQLLVLQCQLADELAASGELASARRTLLTALAIPAPAPMSDDFRSVLREAHCRLSGLLFDAGRDAEAHKFERRAYLRRAAPPGDTPGDLSKPFEDAKTYVPARQQALGS